MTDTTKAAIEAAITAHINDEDTDGGAVVITKFVACVEFVTPADGPWLATIASTDLTKWSAAGMADYIRAKANDYGGDCR